MSGRRHLEARAEADGTLRAWVTDFWRTPLPIEGIAGRVTVTTGDAKQRLDLAPEGGAFVARGPVPAGDSVEARFEVDLPGDALLVDFDLPVSGRSPGAGGVPVDGCQPLDPHILRGVRRLPRCVLPFRTGVGAIATTRDGGRMLVAAEDGGTSEWRLPDVKLALGFAAPPPETIPHGESVEPHGETPDAVAIRPDGKQALVARGRRVLRHSMEDGRVLGEWRSPTGPVRALAWSPDGRSVALVARGDAIVHLLHADDGATVRDFEVDREAWAAGFAPDGRVLAVGSAAGGTTLFDAASGERRAVVDPAGRPVTALGFLGTRGRVQLVTASREGIVATWDPASGRKLGESSYGRGFHSLAVDSSRGRIAIGGAEGDLRLLTADGRGVARLLWHGAEVTGLAFARDLLVSGDTSGRIAVWDLAEPAPSPTAVPTPRGSPAARAAR
ncbi:MAG: WD40 repeat domain-containing protein [Alphaproteobacteria bacterium]